MPMPDWLGLYRNGGKPPTPPTPSGGGLGIALDHPWLTAKGLAWDGPINLIKALWSGAMNAGQAAAPLWSGGSTEGDAQFKALGATGTYDTTKPAWMQALDRAAGFGNAVTMGVGPAAMANIRQAMAENTNATVDDKIHNILRGSGKTIVMDLLPGTEIKHWVTGQNDNGEPLSPEQAGSDLLTGTIKSIPVAAGIGKIQTAATRASRAADLTTEAAKIRRAVGPTTGQMAAHDPTFAAEVGIDTPGTARAAKAGSAATDPADILPAEAETFIAERKVLASQPEFQQVVDSVLSSKVFEEMLYGTKPGEPLPLHTFERLGKAIEKGALGPETGRVLAQLGEAHGLPVEQVTKLAAQKFREIASYGGEQLQVLSDAAAQTLGKLMYRADAGDALATKTLKAMRELGDATGPSTPTSWYSRFTKWSNNTIEQWRRGVLVSQPVTTMRNIQTQGLNYGVVGLFEAGIQGVIENVVGLYKNKGSVVSTKSIGDYYGELLGHVHALAPERLNNPAWNNLDYVLNQIPFVKRKLYDASTWDVSNMAFGDILKGAEGAVEAVKQIPRILNIPNRLQEITYRRLLFSGRLEANIRRLGYESFNEVADLLRKPDPLEPRLAEGILDAQNHALKNTFAYRGNSGLESAIYSVYQHIPFATAILPTFPRFMINQWRWQLERSPTHIFNIFDKTFRQELMSGMDEGFASAKAASTLTKGISGLMQLSGAWILRNSEAAGPKYYQFYTGTTDKNGSKEMLDIRPDNPFSSMFFIADLMKHAAQKTTPPLTGNEIFDAMVGIRRISEQPLFALPDILRAKDASDPSSLVKAFETPIGQYFASFFTPLGALKDFGGAAGKEEWLTQRDTKGQELTGPMRSNIPGIASSLPARVDPFTGTDEAQEHPLLRQLFGANIQGATEMQDLVLRTPKVAVGDLIGNHDSQEADAEVARQLGKILTTPTQGKSTVGDQLASRIKAMNLDDQQRKEVLTEVFTNLRAAAVKQAQQVNAPAFIPHELKKIPLSMRPTYEQLLRSKGLIK